MERKFENILTPIGSLIGSLLGGFIGTQLTVKYGKKSYNGRIPFLIIGAVVFSGLMNKIGSELDRRRECELCCGGDDFDEDDYDEFDEFDDYDDYCED